jgi:hypothetical protein
MTATGFGGRPVSRDVLREKIEIERGIPSTSPQMTLCTMNYKFHLGEARVRERKAGGRNAAAAHVAAR